MEPSNYADICCQVSDIATKVGAYLLAERVSFSQDSVEYKGHNDMVSHVDKFAESMIVNALKGIVASAGFIAEEGTTGAFDADNPPKSGVYWLIDPLDGTTNFIHGLPHYCVSIGLMVDNVMVVGVVFDPNRAECFAAWQGGGAWLNGKSISVSAAPNLSVSLLATGFPYYAFEKMPNYLAVLGNLMQISHGLRRNGSAALDLAYVAAGRFEGFFEYKLKPWDMAAGALIVNEAGGIVTDFENTDNHIFGGNILAASPNTHSEILGIITKHW